MVKPFNKNIVLLLVMFILLFSSVAVTFAAEPLRNPSGEIAAAPRGLGQHFGDAQKPISFSYKMQGFFERLINNLFSIWITSQKSVYDFGENIGPLYLQQTTWNLKCYDAHAVVEFYFSNSQYTGRTYRESIGMVNGNTFYQDGWVIDSWVKADTITAWGYTFCNDSPSLICASNGATSDACKRANLKTSEFPNGDRRISDPESVSFVVQDLSPTTTQTTIPGQTTTTTTIPPYNQPYIIDSGDCTKDPYNCISFDNEEDMVVGRFKIKNNGADMVENWIFEMQVVPQSGQYGSHPMSILGGSIKTCNSNFPSNVHREFRLDRGEELLIPLAAPLPAQQDKTYQVWGIIVRGCGGAHKLNGYWLSDYEDGNDIGTITQSAIIGDGGDGGGTGGTGGDGDYVATDKCRKAVGQSCSPPKAGISYYGDDSGPSDECASGWCQDTEEVGGKCSLVGYMKNNERLKGAEPHPTCVMMGTVKKGFDFAWFGEDSLINGIPNWIIIAGGFFILLIISKMFGGGK